MESTLDELVKGMIGYAKNALNNHPFENPGLWASEYFITNEDQIERLNLRMEELVVFRETKLVGLKYDLSTEGISVSKAVDYFMTYLSKALIVDTQRSSSPYLTPSNLEYSRNNDPRTHNLPSAFTLASFNAPE